MTLHLYIARRFAIALASVTAVFLAFMLLLDVVDQIRRYDIGTISFSQALELSALNVPAAIYRILPLIILLSTLVLFLGLARSSELVIARASGRSALRTLGAPVVTALIYGLLVVGILNPIVAATSKKYQNLSNRYKNGTTSVLSVSRDGLWLRQGSAAGQMLIRASRTSLDGTELTDVTFMAFTTGVGPSIRIEAEAARLEPGAWDIRNAKRWEFGDPGTNPEANASLHAQLTLPSDLTTNRIRDSFGTPSAIPIWELPDFITGLEQAGFSALKHRVWLQMELALPLSFIAMVMIGAGFTMRHMRFGRIGIMVLAALGLGLALYFLRNFAQILGENGQIPVALAAWSPPVIGILAALGLLLHLEDG